MFNNWIDMREPWFLLRRIRQDPAFRRRILGRFPVSRRARVASHWSHTESPPVNWWDIPAVQARWNRMITGKSTKSHQEYVAGKFAGRKTLLDALSPGCGTGGKEILWARTGKFRRIDAYDLSEERIRAANRSLGNSPEAAIVRYRTADVATLDLPAHHYDMVMFEHSLHHFSPLDALFTRLQRIVKPGGLIVANEYVGPTRFQWSDTQLSVVNDLLDLFPEEYSTLFSSQFTKPGARRPSKLAMWLSDPSEAIESARIRPLLEKHFEPVETRGYGGSVLHILFSGIAHHFIEPDEKARKLLDLCFSVEDLLLERGVIEHDFALLVYRNGRRLSFAAGEG